MRARVLIRPKAGILDPQGIAVERALPALGFERRLQRPRRPARRARRRRRRAARRDVPAAAGQPADRGLRDRSRRRTREVRRRPFPGTCDDADALLAAERVGEAVALWHARRATCRASTRSSSPAASPTATTCASARSRASRRSMESVIAFARDGGPVLGICNGFQVLCEAGLLPGALLPNDRPALHLPPGRRSRSSNADTPFTRACAPGELLSIPVKHTTGRYYAPEPSSTRSRPTARWCCATRPARTPTARCDDIAGVRNEARQRRRPDAPPRARGRPAAPARPTG